MPTCLVWAVLMNEFKRFVSLGSACRTRHQVDRHFGARAADYKPSAAFFDWLWGPEIDGVIRALQGGLKIARENLAVARTGPRIQVQDAATGFYFLHDFRFSEAAVSDPELAHQQMHEQLDRFLEKYEYLGAKTREMLSADDGLCLVYHGRMSPLQLEALYATLGTDYGCRPTLLNVLPVTHAAAALRHETLADCVITRTVDDRASDGTADAWKGVDESWDLALADFGCSGHPG